MRRLSGSIGAYQWSTQRTLDTQRVGKLHPVSGMRSTKRTLDAQRDEVGIAQTASGMWFTKRTLYRQHDIVNSTQCKALLRGDLGRPGLNHGTRCGGFPNGFSGVVYKKKSRCTARGEFIQARPTQVARNSALGRLVGQMTT